MALWVKILLVSFGMAVVGVGLALLVGSILWNRATARAAANLIGKAPQGASKRVSFKDLEGLPAPVAEYFWMALKDGQPLIRSVRIIQTGEFRSRPGDNGWSLMKATEYLSANPPGFIWDANIGMGPVVKVQVRDAYLAGQGSMLAKVFALAPVLDTHDKAELNAGALQRYLAEAAWIPTALLPGERLKWSAIDDTRALATLTDCGITVSLEFRFNTLGEITGVFTPGRYREVDGKYELAPWAGHLRRYEKHHGMRIPMEAEVEWQLPEGSIPYWRGRVESVTFDFEP